MLTKQEEQQLTQLIQKLNPGDLPLPVFEALYPRVVLTPIETVILRKNNGAIEVFLTRRPDNDKFYAGQWHSPGTILRPSDRSYEDAFRRLEKKELGVPFAKKPQLADSFIIKTKRGTEHSVVFLCSVEETPKTGEFYDIEILPKNLVEQHYQIIATAVKRFKNTV